jgi:hypothetical protein
MTKHLQGDPGMKGVFATRVSGSADLYQVLSPLQSISHVLSTYWLLGFPTCIVPPLGP